MAGFVKLYRSLLDWEWYMDVNTHRLFTHLLLTVNWKDGKWKGKVIKRGQRVTSVGKLAKETRLSIRQIRTSMEHLKSTGEVTITSTNRYTLITVEKYEEYQGCDDVTDKPNDKPIGKQPTTIEESKKKEERYIEIPTELQEAFKDFADMRNKIKKPLVGNAANLILKKLDTLSGGDPKIKIEILNQSTMNSWQGVFALKETDKPKPTINRREL